MKQVISEKDYEKYKIYVPVKLFLNGRQRKYISSLLEKLHPCFSDNFCFDSKYGISKKGICADVVVMDKLRLGEYKATYPGQTLTCGENGGEKVFADKKNRLIRLPLVFVAMVAFFGVMIGVNKSKQNEKLYANKKIENRDYDNLSGAEEKSLSGQFFAYEKFFDLFESQDGKVESFKWKYDGFTEQIWASVLNCYPENFSDQARTVSFSNINYSDDVTSFSMNVVNQVTTRIDSNPASMETEAFQTEDYRAKVREILKENSIKLIGENYLPFKIRFEISEKDVAGKIFSKIGDASKEAGLCVKEIEISMTNKNIADVEIYFTKEFSYDPNKSILLCVEDNWEIFSVKMLNGKNNFSNTGIRVLAMNGENQRGKNELKLGTIIHPNGEKVDFYKTAKGVILND